MAYSATLAHMRGLISDTDYKRILGLFSRAGLSMDHPDFNEDILEKATKAILKVRSFPVILSGVTAVLKAPDPRRQAPRRDPRPSRLVRLPQRRRDGRNVRRAAQAQRGR